MSASVESPSWRTVEVGRLVLINNGPFAGRIAAIVEIISEKRVSSFGIWGDHENRVQRRIGG
ncbi:hypothetical protein RRF57_009642 [Xylaria bambusicola]|uniref:KOW domain-containing protein n=1 Tax=Xylaria bambusicola TaxID=326684 RepID=A0AAN7UQS9_9PEZI